MKQVLWLLKRLLQAAIFFTLFAFALNNQQDTTVHFFFGNQWRAPQVLVVLSAFAIGVAVGVLGMVPWWWRHRQVAQPPTGSVTTPSTSNTSPSTPAAATAPSYADGI